MHTGTTQGWEISFPMNENFAYKVTGLLRTALTGNGKLFTDLSLPALDPANDRVMTCGSPQMLKELAQAPLNTRHTEP